jgi:hypothetical protein
VTCARANARSLLSWTKSSSHRPWLLAVVIRTFDVVGSAAPALHGKERSWTGRSLTRSTIVAVGTNAHPSSKGDRVMRRSAPMRLPVQDTETG